jgi:hypothetical protein
MINISIILFLSLWSNLTNVSNSPDRVIDLLEHLNVSGRFEANCIILFDNKRQQVECSISDNISVFRGGFQRLPGVPLPNRYIKELYRNNILMTHVIGDWRRGRFQEQVNDLWLKKTYSLTPTITPTISGIYRQRSKSTISDTRDILDTKTTLETRSIAGDKTTSITASISNMASISDKVSISDTTSISNKVSISNTATISDMVSVSDTMKRIYRRTRTRSRSLSSCLGMSKNLMSVWSRVNGTYADFTNQTLRYTAVGGVITDALTKLKWITNGSSLSRYFSQAELFCAGMSFRLPNIAELQTFMQFTLDTNIYWSSTLTPSSVYGLYRGNLTTIDRNDAFVAYCVKDVPYIPVCRYVIQGIMVKDILTNLTWQRGQSVVAMNHTSATLYCSGLSQRLPTFRELSTLINYNTTGSKIDMGVFPDTTPALFWATFLWAVSFVNGDVKYYMSNESYFVRCVS